MPPSPDKSLAEPTKPASHRRPSSEQAVHRVITRYRRLVTEPLTGYLFIAPAVLLIALFGLFPVGYAAYMSLYHWRVRQGAFVGFDNYARMLGEGPGIGLTAASLVLLALACWLRVRAWPSEKARRRWHLMLLGLCLAGAVTGLGMGWSHMLATTQDERFLRALPITFFYALGSIPLQLAVGLALAMALLQRLRGTAIFRTVFLVPYIMPTVATAMVFRLLFSERSTSVANQVVTWFGLAPQKWLAEPRPVLEAFFGLHLPAPWAGPSLALVTIIIFGVWIFVGYNVIVFLAGLSTIPPELYEAGELDGANRWALLRYITLPLLSPVTFYLTLIGFIGTFKAFNSIYAMRLPQAQGSVDTASVVIFDTMYKANQYGEAAAQAILLFVLVAGLTYMQQRVIGTRVFYGA